VGFAVDKAARGQVFSEYFGFPCQSFYQFLHHHNHLGLLYFLLHYFTQVGHAVAQAVSHWLPTVAAQVRVRATGVCGGQNGMGRFSPSTSVSLANHSTNFSIIIITRGWHNTPITGRSAKWTQLDSTPHYTNNNNNDFYTSL
jgi:hypothetical protein